MVKKIVFFVKTPEDFVCDVCGKEVIGTGYTDHCSDCLWSLHVDVNPGDRMSECGGLMKPIGIKKNGRRVQILYQCQKCSYTHPNEMADSDNIDAVIAVSPAPVKEKKPYLCKARKAPQWSKR